MHFICFFSLMSCFYLLTCGTAWVYDQKILIAINTMRHPKIHLFADQNEFLYMAYGHLESYVEVYLYTLFSWSQERCSGSALLIFSLLRMFLSTCFLLSAFYWFSTYIWFMKLEIKYTYTKQSRFICWLWEFFILWLSSETLPFSENSY